MCTKHGNDKTKIIKKLFKGGYHKFGIMLFVNELKVNMTRALLETELPCLNVQSNEGNRPKFRRCAATALFNGYHLFVYFSFCLLNLQLLLHGLKNKTKK